jgi:hypothetical protein
MVFTPSRSLGLAVALAAAAVAAGLGAGAIAYLRLAPVSFLAFLALCLLALAVLVVAFVGYRSYGLARGRYVLSRNALVVEWGWRRELMPMADIRDMRAITEPAALASLHPRGFAWPGCLVGHANLPEWGPVEFLAGSSARGLVVVEYDAHALALSPADPQAFVQTFASLQAQGPSAAIEPESVVPGFQRWSLWQDRLALGLITAGGLSALVLWGYLQLAAERQPAPSASPLDLLLWPLLAGIAWLVNTLLGLELRHRPAERSMAYVLFGATLFVQAVLWAAAGTGAAAGR